MATRARREAALVARLVGLSFPLGLSRVLAVLPAERGVATISEPIAGIPLDPRASRTPGGRPWEYVAGAAAAIHSVDAAVVGDIVGGAATRREHALSKLAVLERIDVPEARDARAWAEEHLPPADASHLVHGDLLGQNLLLRPGAPLAVLDWEYASLGDPAFDLAIVTRGVRRPFQVEGGLRRLLESYASRSPIPVSVEHVRLHEACLLAGFYEAAVRQDGGISAAADQARTVFAGFVRLIASA